MLKDDIKRQLDSRNIVMLSNIGAAPPRAPLPSLPACAWSVRVHVQPRLWRRRLTAASWAGEARLHQDPWPMTWSAGPGLAPSEHAPLAGSGDGSTHGRIGKERHDQGRKVKKALAQLGWEYPSWLVLCPATTTSRHPAPAQPCGRCTRAAAHVRVAQRCRHPDPPRRSAPCRLYGVWRGPELQHL